MGMRIISIAALTATLVIIRMTNAVSSYPSPRSDLSTKTRTIEPRTWVLDGSLARYRTVNPASEPE